MEPTNRPVRDIGHVRLTPDRETRTIWNTGLLGWVSLAVFALMLFVVSQLVGLRHDLQEVVITESDDLAKVHAEVRNLRNAVKELTLKLEERPSAP